VKIDKNAGGLYFVHFLFDSFLFLFSSAAGGRRVAARGAPAKFKKCAEKKIAAHLFIPNRKHP
jgi:hypothetical protein